MTKASSRTLREILGGVGVEAVYIYFERKESDTISGCEDGPEGDARELFIGASAGCFWWSHGGDKWKSSSLKVV